MTNRCDCASRVRDSAKDKSFGAVIGRIRLEANLDDDSPMWAPELKVLVYPEDSLYADRLCDVVRHAPCWRQPRGQWMASDEYDHGGLGV